MPNLCYGRFCNQEVESGGRRARGLAKYSKLCPRCYNAAQVSSASQAVTSSTEAPPHSVAHSGVDGGALRSDNAAPSVAAPLPSSDTLCIETRPDNLPSFDESTKNRPHRSCSNYPMCTCQRSKKKDAKGFCTTCSTAASCVHPGCASPRAPPFARDKVVTLCAAHYAEPCYNATRMWNACSNAREGCRLLAVASRGGKCHPCSQARLPCIHAHLGCPHRVLCASGEPRTACRPSSLSKCPFTPANRTRCQTPWCGVPLTAGTGPRICPHCSTGQLPCMNNCGRRASASTQSLCLSCAASSRDPLPPASTSITCSTPSCTNAPHTRSLCMPCLRGLLPCASLGCVLRAPPDNDGFCFRCSPPVALPVCATHLCANIVHLRGDYLCSLCISGSPPCSTPLCPRRAQSGGGSICKICESALASSSARLRCSRKRPAPSCANSELGCNGTASRASTALAPFCDHCLRLGPPCQNASSGCLRRVGTASAESKCDLCRRQDGPQIDVNLGL